jgi:hypothetical protein
MCACVYQGSAVVIGDGAEGQLPGSRGAKDRLVEQDYRCGTLLRILEPNYRECLCYIFFLQGLTPEIPRGNDERGARVGGRPEGSPQWSPQHYPTPSGETGECPSTPTLQPCP